MVQCVKIDNCCLVLNALCASVGDIRWSWEGVIDRIRALSALKSIRRTAARLENSGLYFAIPEGTEHGK